MGSRLDCSPCATSQLFCIVTQQLGVCLTPQGLSAVSRCNAAALAQCKTYTASLRLLRTQSLCILHSIAQMRITQRKLTLKSTAKETHMVGLIEAQKDFGAGGDVAQLRHARVGRADAARAVLAPLSAPGTSRQCKLGTRQSQGSMLWRSQV